MKILFKILVLLLIGLTAKSQSTPLPYGLPSPYSRNWYRVGWNQSDSGTIFAGRDTTLRPRFAGTTIFWSHPGVDSLTWLWDGFRWKKMGTGGGGGQPDTIIIQNIGSGYFMSRVVGDTAKFKSLSPGTNFSIDSVSIPGTYILNASGGASTPTLQQVFNTQVGGAVLTKSDTILLSGTQVLKMLSTSALRGLQINATGTAGGFQVTSTASNDAAIVSSSTANAAISSSSSANSILAAAVFTATGTGTPGASAHVSDASGTNLDVAFTIMKATNSLSANGGGVEQDFMSNTSTVGNSIGVPMIKLKGIVTDFNNATFTGDFHIALSNAGSFPGTDQFVLKSTGETDFGAYGSGTFTGTPTFNLAVTSAGKIIEVATGGGGGGVASLSAIGSSPNANGATITGTVLNLEPANASFGGVFTTGTQTFAGSKTFNSDLTVNSISVGLGKNSVASNTAVGVSVLSSGSLTGANNTGVGEFVLNGNTSGGQNTGVGVDALFSNTTGSGNTAGGYLSAAAGASVSNVTAFGSQALRNNIADGNSAFGDLSLNANSLGTNNSAFGITSLALNTIGQGNSAFGGASQDLDVDGSFNSTLGYGSLSSNFHGSRNTGIGYLSLDLDTAGNDNTAVGNYSLQAILIGGRNTVVGSNALSGNTYDSEAIAIGYHSFFQDTSRQILAISIGDNNFQNFGSNNNVLDSSIAIGHNITATPVRAVNSIAIGNNLVIAAANKAYFGTASQVLQLGNGGQTQTAINALTGGDADLVYNKTNHYYQHYNGTDWQPMTDAASNITNQSAGTYTISASDITVIFTGSTSTWTFPSTYTGKKLNLVNQGTGSITLGTAVTTANGVTSTTLTAGSNYQIQYDGTVWRKIN